MPLKTILSALVVTWAPVIGLFFVIKKRKAIFSEVSDIGTAVIADMSEMGVKKRICLLSITPIVATFSITGTYYLDKYCTQLSCAVGVFFMGPLPTGVPQPIAPFEWTSASTMKLWTVAACLWALAILLPATRKPSKMGAD